MYYIIYKIINKINNKEYIGKHKTNDIYDEYMGSGKLLKHAINKHGIDNFKKEILFIFDNEKEMNDKEAELVTEEYCKYKHTYNICPGGKGGWGYINSNRLWSTEAHSNAARKNQAKANKKVLELMKDKEFLENFKNKVSLGVKKYYSTNGSHWVGRKHNDVTKRKIGEKNSIHQKGSKNSQYGTCWITNGKENKKIKKEDIDFWIDKGYTKGRS